MTNTNPFKLGGINQYAYDRLQGALQRRGVVSLTLEPTEMVARFANTTDAFQAEIALCTKFSGVRGMRTEPLTIVFDFWPIVEFDGNCPIYKNPKDA